MDLPTSSSQTYIPHDSPLKIPIIQAHHYILYLFESLKERVHLINHVEHKNNLPDTVECRKPPLYSFIPNTIQFSML